MRRTIGALLILAACQLPENQAQGGGKGDSVEVQFIQGSREDICKEILNRLRDAYVNENVHGFMSWVARDYARDYTLLREAIERDIRSFDVIVLDFFLERIVAAGTDRIVETRWEKRYDERQGGRRVTAKGRTSFIFKDTKDGYRLHEMKGDLLFGFSLPELGQSVDLEVVSVTADWVGPTFNMSATIRNNGNADAQRARIRVAFTNAPGAGGDQFVAVLAGRTVTVTWNNLSPGGPGEAIVTADPLNEFQESNELNNERRDPFGGPP